MAGVTNPHGATLAGRLADIAAEARIKARAVTLGPEKAATDTLITTIMERLEADMAPHMADVVGWLQAQPDLPAGIAAVLDQTTSPAHQFNFVEQIVVLVGFVLTAMFHVGEPYVQATMNQLWEGDPTKPVPPDVAALAELKGVVGEGFAAQEGPKSGFAPEAMAILLGVAGEPPGLEMLLTAFRRGFIDAGRLEHGIRQSRVRNEWADVVTALRYAPIPPGTAVAAAVQNHLDPGAAAKAISDNGIDPAWFDVMYATAGRPPGTGEMLELLNRGEVAEADVVQAIRESDVKDKYIAPILKMRYRLPPERSVVAMVRRGALTPAEGTDHLNRLGYHPDDVAALIGEATESQQAEAKALTVGQIVAAYEAGLMDRGTARAHIDSLRYADADAGILLSLADARRQQKFADAAVSRIRTLYAGYRIDRAQASTALDGLGVEADMRDHHLSLWTLERDANQRDLTEAQIVGAWRRGLFDDATAHARLVQAGYSDADASLLMQVALPLSAFQQRGQ